MARLVLLAAQPGQPDGALALPAAPMQLVITTGLAAAPHVTPEVALGFGLRICSA